MYQTHYAHDIGEIVKFYIIRAINKLNFYFLITIKFRFSIR